MLRGFLLLSLLLITAPTRAALYHGVFIGTVSGLYGTGPVNDGDSFVLGFEIKPLPAP